MRLLEILSSNKFRLTRNFREGTIPPYAILSHTWGDDEDEVTYEDMMRGLGRDKPGYKKLMLCGTEATRDRLEYIWIDTCCIDKSSSAELQESINSMYKWYQNADVCYAFIEDWLVEDDWADLVPLGQGENRICDNEIMTLSNEELLKHMQKDREDKMNPGGKNNAFDGWVQMDDTHSANILEMNKDIPSFSNEEVLKNQEKLSVSFEEDQAQIPDSSSRDGQIKKNCPLKWFTRGWTLQELIAPRQMKFFDTDWTFRGAKSDPIVASWLNHITGVPVQVLSTATADALKRCSIGSRMSWAAYRQTSREEDAAYCLLGIFGVHMPLLYGEGSNAFMRLEEEIMKYSTDLSIFAWIDCSKQSGIPKYRGIFAPHPRFFHHLLGRIIHVTGSSEFTLTNKGLRIDIPLTHPIGAAPELRTYASGVMSLDCWIDGKIQGIYLEAMTGIYARVLSHALIEVPHSATFLQIRSIYIARDLGSNEIKMYHERLEDGILVNFQSCAKGCSFFSTYAWPSHSYDHNAFAFVPMLRITDSPYTAFLTVMVTPSIKSEFAGLQFVLLVKFNQEEFDIALYSGEAEQKIYRIAKSTSSLRLAMEKLSEFHSKMSQGSVCAIELSSPLVNKPVRITATRMLRRGPTEQQPRFYRAIKLELSQ